MLSRRSLSATAAVSAAFGAAYALRLHDGATNVDDYLYARQTDTFRQALVDGQLGVVQSWKLFTQNSPLVPYLATPLDAIDRHPSTLVLVQLPLLLVLLGTVGLLLSQLGATRRWVAAAAVTALPCVLSYSVMLSFALAATACTAGVLAAYLASDRLRRRRPALVLGLLLGLLSLSRVVAVVYLAAVGLALGLDLLLDRTDARKRLTNAGLTLASVGLVAAPWWLTAGPGAVRYLRDAGYAADSTFTTQASLLTREVDRLLRTADETGVILLVLLAVAALVTAAKGTRPQRLVTITALLVLAGLGTSSNAGTAFALPAVVLLSVVAAAGISALPRPAARAALAVPVVGLIGLLLPMVPLTVDRHPLWISGTPAREQVDQALGCRCRAPRADDVNAAIVAAVGSQRLLILRNDAIVNPESLRFFAGEQGRALDIVGPAADPLADLTGITWILAGSTAAPYFGVDLTDPRLEALGPPVLDVDLSAANSVILYRLR